MIILVTGGAGFIGSHLFFDVSAAGQHQVLVLDKLSREKKFKFGSQI